MAIVAQYAAQRPHDEKAWELWSDVAGRRPGEAHPVAVLEKGLTVLPGSPRLKYLLGMALLDDGQSEKARVQFRGLDEQAPHSCLGPLGLGAIAARSGAWEDALRWLRLAEDRGARVEYQTLRDLYARVLDIPRQREWAMELLETSVRLRPKDPLGHLLLGVMNLDDEPEAAHRHLGIARHNWREDYGDFQTTLAEATDRLRSAT